MRKVIISFLLFSCISQTIFAQDEEGNKYTASYLIVDIFPMKPCKIDGIATGEEAISSQPKKYIKLITEMGNEIIVRLVEFPKKVSELQLKYNGTIEQPIYYKISKSDFENRCIRLYDTWKGIVTFGAVLLPVKFRSHPSDFTKDYTLGPSIGVKYRFDNVAPNYLNFMYTFGITATTISPDNATGTTTNKELASLTHAVGVVAEFNTIQVGVFMGWDKLRDADAKAFNWVYNGNTWYSIGFGIKILSDQKRARISYQYNEQKNITKEDASLNNRLYIQRIGVGSKVASVDSSKQIQVP